jgi:GT2 family glycosyltransferase/glycosyltransferase involved in cell wall biosynthesis
MRIVYLAPRMVVAGGIRVILEHVNRLGARGHECHVVVREGPAELDWLETTAEMHTFEALPALAADADAVVATAWFTAYDVANLSAGPKKCYLVQGRETVFFPRQPDMQEAVERTFTLPLEYITVSSYLADYLKSQGVRAALAMNGVDFDLFFPDPEPFPRESERPRILVEGDSGQPWKRVPETIAALDGLGAEFWTFAPSPQTPPGSHRHFVSPDQDTIRRIYSSCDVMAKGSSLEGFGYGPAEAMACRTAVAITDFGGGKDICIDGKTALVAQPDDFAGLRRAVQRLLTDDALRSGLAEAGYDHVRKTLRWDASIDALEAAIAKGMPRKRVKHRAGPQSVKPLPVHSRGIKTEVEGRPEGAGERGFAGGVLGGGATGGPSGPVASIVIPVHNQSELTELCLSTIERCTTDIAHEVVVIDNGSTDGTKEVLAKHPSVRVIRNKKNKGVGPAWNQGIKAAKGRFIAVINNDVVVTEGWLSRLVAGFDMDHEVGIICPRFTHHEMPPDFEAVASAVAAEPPALSYEMQPDAYHLLVGFAYVLKREVVDKVGLFDEDFEMMLYEDQDYQDRVLEAGFKIASVSNVLVHHFQSATVYTIDDWMKYEIANKALYEAKSAERAAAKAPAVSLAASSDEAWLPSGSKKRVFLLTADFWGCGWYRLHVPGVALAAKGYEVAMEDELPQDVIEHFDVFVMQRQFRPEMIPLIRALRSMGKTVIGELDDDFWHLHEDSPVLGFWYGDGGVRLKVLEQFLGECDWVTTSTKPLAQVLRKFNPKVKVVPNQLPGPAWKARHKPRKDGKLIIGWAGGEPHGKDVALLAGTMEQIVEEYPHVELHLAGMSVYPFVAHPRIVALQPVTIEHYPKLLSGFDIGLAPIVDSAFNRAKSDLKFIEYGMVGVPAILSRVEPYLRVVKHGENGFLAQNPKDWLKFLKRLVEDEKLRTDIADAAHEYAVTRTIAKNVGLWEEAYGLK